MGISSRSWTTPSLIVLARNNPAEAVLSACKLVYTAGGFDAGPLQAFNGCYEDPGGTGCSGCSAPAVS
jgi:hypothetical protein